MILSDICIKRPVFTIVIMVMLVVIGLVSFTDLTVRHYPKIDRPVISVITTYEGASAQMIETLVTKPIEGALSGLEGLDYMTSSSETGNSAINLYLHTNRNVDDAATDVRDKLSRVYMLLPEGARYPTVKKAEAESQALLYLALTGEAHSQADLYYHANKQIKPVLEAVSGVANVDIEGGDDMVMHLRLDPAKLSAHHISAHQVAQALKHNNIEIPAGQLITAQQTFHVKTSARLSSTEAFNRLIVGEHQGSPIRLQEVGVADFAPAVPKSQVRFNGKTAIALSVIKKSVANPVEISAQIHTRLPSLADKLPSTMQISIGFDKSTFIKQSIDEVYKTIFEAIVCVLIVIGLFLWSVRAALIPLITIPVSLIASFSLLYLFGCSINVLTLLAMVLAIGLVVDDAIVMLENIHRHIESGLSPVKAAIKGAKEIRFAIIAMTLTLASVYAPIALSQGEMGKLFTEFAITLAGAVLISGFVALTLSPMMCAKLLTTTPQHNTLLDRVYRTLATGYQRSLRWSLQYRYTTIMFGVFMAMLGLFIAGFVLKSEVTPREDQGMVLVFADPPQGATLNYVAEHTTLVEKTFKDQPEIISQMTLIEPQQMRSWMVLTDWQQRDRSSVDIIRDVRPTLADIAGLHVYASAGSGLTASGAGGHIRFVMQTTQSFNTLHVAAVLLEKALRQSGVINNLMADYGSNVHQWNVDINRDKALALGVSVDIVAETLAHFMSQRRIGHYHRQDEQFDVQISMDKSYKKSPDQLLDFYVQGNEGQMIPLSQLIDIQQEPVPTEIRHFNQLRAITLSGELAPGYSLSDAVTLLTRLSKQVLPKTVSTDFAGETKQLIESRYAIYLIFGLALLFIYLVMAAQFESFKDPLMIMLSVPLSMSGGLLMLYFIGGSFNIYTQIGFITLIGLITKHGILIIDFANRHRQAGMTARLAIQAAVQQRLRPILMTTLAMIGGSIPLMSASGAGAESRYQLGGVIIGGMFLGTLLTLYVIPVIYTFLSTNIAKK